MPAQAELSSLLPSLPPGARVLAVRLRSLGDTVLLTPALRALKQWRPDLRISVLLYRRFAPILAGNPDIEEVLPLDPEGPQSLLAVAQMTATLRQRSFAACFNFHGGTMSALLTCVSGAPRRVCPEHFRFRFLYTDFSPPPETIFGRSAVHTAEVQLSLLRAAGLPAGKIPAARVIPQEAARRKVQEALRARGLASGARYAVLHPVANFFTKEWPFDRYAALAAWLEERHALTPVFLCGPGESNRLDAVAQHSRKPLVRFDSLPLAEMVALIEGADLFVGNDSGPAHVAAALDRPTVVLFGSSNSVRWRPWKTRHEIVQNDYACNPCKGDRCYAFAQPECILSIRLDQVEAAVERVLIPAAAERPTLPASVR